MPSLVLRLLVLMIAVLLQASSWHAEAYSSAGLGATPSLVLHDGERNCDPPEDSSEQVSAVDDSLGSDVVSANGSNWNTPLVTAAGYAWVDGLPPGGPPTETPFKPPRA